MGHDWIKIRLKKAVGAASPAWPALRDKGKAVYSRHVLFFSIPQAVSHAEALILHVANKPINPNMHAAHEITREWGDAAIDKVVDNRAGLINEGRKR